MTLFEWCLSLGGTYNEKKTNIAKLNISQTVNLKFKWNGVKFVLDSKTKVLFNFNVESPRVWEKIMNHPENLKNIKSIFKDYHSFNSSKKIASSDDTE